MTLEERIEREEEGAAWDRRHAANRADTMLGLLSLVDVARLRAQRALEAATLEELEACEVDGPLEEVRELTEAEAELDKVASWRLTSLTEVEEHLHTAQALKNELRARGYAARKYPHRRRADSLCRRGGCRRVASRA